MSSSTGKHLQRSLASAAKSHNLAHCNLRWPNYHQFSIIIRSLDCSSSCGKSSHLPSLDTGSPPIHPPTDFSGTKTCRTFRVLRSKKSISPFSLKKYTPDPNGLQASPIAPIKGMP